MCGISRVRPVYKGFYKVLVPRIPGLYLTFLTFLVRIVHTLGLYPGVCAVLQKEEKRVMCRF